MGPTYRGIIGARGRKVGSIQGSIIGGQVLKSGFLSWVHYWRKEGAMYDTWYHLGHRRSNGIIPS